MKNFIFLVASIFILAGSAFSQTAITLTQNQPVIQPMIAPYWDFVALNQVAATRSVFYIQDSSLSKVTLAAAQNGSTVYLKAVAGDTVQLPAVSAVPIGAKFVVIIAYSATSVGHCVYTSGTDVFYGTCFVSSTSSAYTNPFLSTANKTILMSTTTTGGLAGGELEFISLGYGRWYTHALLYATGTPATPFKN